MLQAREREITGTDEKFVNAGVFTLVIGPRPPYRQVRQTWRLVNLPQHNTDERSQTAQEYNSNPSEGGHSAGTSTERHVCGQ